VTKRASSRELTGSRVLITGGAGFIATNVIRALVDSCEIVVLDTMARNALALAPWRHHPHVRVIKGDVRDVRVVRRAAAGADYVLHMAAVAGVGTVVRSPASTFDINLLGTHTVLSVLKGRKNLRRFVDFSTSEVYGPHVFRASEEGMTTQGSIYQPRWFYAVSKLASEYLTRAYHVEHGLPTASIRPFNVYGPYQYGEGAVRNFALAALAGRPLTVHGEGEQIRSWCYVDDMVDAILACLISPQAVGHHFNIGNPRATMATLELARMILRLSGSRSPLRFKKIRYPDVEVRVPSIALAERRLGFQPKVDMEDGLTRTIVWYRTEGRRWV
jgi:nucleoside-diphosphate-sugar epimerase